MFLQADEQGGEVRVAGQDDEFVEMGGVGQVIHAVHDQMDVRAGLAAGGQGRTVHHLEGAADEMVTEFLIALGVEVTHALQDAAAHAVTVEDAQGVVLDPAHPAVGGHAEGPGRFGVCFKKTGVNVVKVHIQGAVHFIKTGKTCHNLLNSL